MCDLDLVLLSAYADDEVTAAERAEVEAHLAGCSDCRAELRRLRETAVMASLLPDLPPPPDLRMRILDRTTRRRSPWARAREWASRPAVWSPAAAAGLVVLMLVSLHGSPHRGHLKSRTQSVELAVRPPRTGPQKAEDDFHHALADMKAKATDLYNNLHESFGGSSDDGDAGAQIADRPTDTTRIDAQPAVLVVRPGLGRDTTRRLLALPSKKRRSPGRSSVRPAKTPAFSGSRPRRPSADLIIPDAPPATAAPAPSSSDGMMAMSPPMMPMPDMPKTVETPAPSPPPTEAGVRPSNPIAVEFVKLADTRPSKQRSTDEIVQQLNASALSASREVQWKFARIKF